MAALKKIFLVDDDHNNNEMLKMHLSSKFNLEILTFSTGEDCIRNIDLKPDYIILDYNLNSVKTEAANGIDILKKIKELKPEVYVLFLSGQDKIEVAVDTIKYGAYDYVVKNQSSFLRIENCLVNIHKNIRLQYLARAYRFATFFLGGILIAIIILAILLKIFGISAINPGWV